MMNKLKMAHGVQSWGEMFTLKAKILKKIVYFTRLNLSSFNDSIFGLNNELSLKR